MNKTINGFSKLSKQQKIQWVAETFAVYSVEMVDHLNSWLHPDPAQQKVLDGFTENALTKYMPFQW